VPPPQRVSGAAFRDNVGNSPTIFSQLDDAAAKGGMSQMEARPADGRLSIDNSGSCAATSITQAKSILRSHSNRKPERPLQRNQVRSHHRCCVRQTRWRRTSENSPPKAVRLSGLQAKAAGQPEMVPPPEGGRCRTALSRISQISAPGWCSYNRREIANDSSCSTPSQRQRDAPLVFMGGIGAGAETFS